MSRVGDAADALCPSPLPNRPRLSFAGFTLIEMLGVIAVIGVLVGLIIGVASYARYRSAGFRAKAQLAALEMAIEAYKADVGYYPVSTDVRFSGDGNAQLSNSACLYRALTTTPKRYYSAKPEDIGSASFIYLTYGNNYQWTTGNSVTFFRDPWGRPWNYYRPAPPKGTVLVVSNIKRVAGSSNTSYAVGGQMNPATYDLMSVGPDGATYIPGATINADYWLNVSINGSIDDITNWKR